MITCPCCGARLDVELPPDRGQANNLVPETERPNGAVFAALPGSETGGNYHAEMVCLERLVRITGPTSYCGAWDEHEKWKEALRAHKAKSLNGKPSDRP